MVSAEGENKEVARLERLNSELASSLERCRDLLRDCRSKLAANANDVAPPEDDEETRLG